MQLQHMLRAKILFTQNWQAKSFCRAVCLLRNIGSTQTEEEIWTISKCRVCISIEIPKALLEIPLWYALKKHELLFD